MNESGQPAVLVIPKSRGGVAAAFVFTGFVVFFVAVAIDNLLHGVAWISSVLWLGIVVVGIRSSCREKGFRRHVIGLLGAFSSRHFADTVTDDGVTKVRFGFRLFRRPHILRIVAVPRIESVEWRTGQATGLAGRDMGDWQVALWFDHEDTARSEREKNHRKPDQDVYMVGPPRKKEVTAGFGQEFLAFLRQAGARLVPGPDDCTYRRA